MVCLGVFSVFISITQFSDFLITSYGNWKHILGVFKLWKLSFHGILVNKYTLLGLTSLVKSDFSSLPPITLLFFLFLFFFSTFLSFCLSSFSVLFFVLLQSKISPTPKDKRILALPIHGLSSPIWLSFVVLHPCHANPSEEQHLNAAQP